MKLLLANLIFLSIAAPFLGPTINYLNRSPQAADKPLSLLRASLIGDGPQPIQQPSITSLGPPKPPSEIESQTNSSQSTVINQPNYLTFAQVDIPTLQWGKLQKESVEIAIQNTSVLDYALTLRLSGLGVKDMAGNILPEPDLIETEAVNQDPELKPKTSSKQTAESPSKGCENAMKVQALSILKVKLSAKSNLALRPGVYLGMLSVVGKSCGTIPPLSPVAAQAPQSDKRDVRFVVEGGSSIPEPLVTEWVIDACRAVPFSNRWMFDYYIPLKNKSSETNLNLEENQLLGSVTRTQSVDSEGLISWKGTTPLDGGKLGLLVKVDGLRNPGVYKGNINLNPRINPVSLTLNVTDFFLWPFLALLIGIGLAILIERWMNVIRAIWLMKKHESDIGTNFGEAKKEFDTTSKGHEYDKYSIEKSVLSARQDIVNRVNGISKFTSPKLDDKNPTYHEIQAKLESLNEAVKAWRGFSGELYALEEALKQLEPKIKDADKPPVPEGEEKRKLPQFMDTAKALLKDSKPISIEEFQVMRKKVIDATKLASEWQSLNDQIIEYLRWIESLKKLGLTNNEELNALKNAEGSMVSVWEHLWSVQDLDEMSKESIKENLKAAEDNILKLAYHFRAPSHDEALENVAVPENQPMLMKYASLTGLSTALSNLLPAPVEDRARSKFYGALVRRFDKALLSLVLLLAIYAGMDALYFTKQFGNVIDYLKALTWGFTAKAALDIFSKGFSELTTRWLGPPAI